MNVLFEVGDKVLYPMHGAGIIKAIEEKEIQGKKQDYCIITIPISNMDVMIPLANLEKVGIRKLVDPKTLKEILDSYHNEAPDLSLSWRERYNSNMEKIKSGELDKNAEVVRELLHRSKEKALNASEKQMLNNARKILISELTLIKGISETEAADLLEISG